MNDPTRSRADQPTLESTRTPTPMPMPTSIVLHRQSRRLEIAFDDGQRFDLPFELLRVYSPSAEVQGHGPGQEVLQFGKAEVDIVALDQVGHYAVQPHFSDGHSSGIYPWPYLHFLGVEQTRLWAEYRAKVAAASGEQPPAPVTPCASHRPR